MDIINVFFESEAKNIAKAPALILRQNNSFRYLFSPYLVINENQNENNLRAKLIIQKKNLSDKWEEFNTFKLTDMRKGDWFNVDIKSSELSLLLEYCSTLKKEFFEEGKVGFFDTRKVVIIDDGNYDDLQNFLIKLKNNPNCKLMLENLLNVSNEKVVNFLSENIDDLRTIIYELEDNVNREIYSIIFAKTLNYNYILDNLDNSDENFWQTLFELNPQLLTNCIPALLHFIQGNPYVGGKGIDNRNGVISDLLYEFGQNNIALIELKTPCTLLMESRPYRNNVYSPTSDLTGAIVQVKAQRDKIVKNYYALNNESSVKFNSYDPKMYIIVGNKQKLNNEQNISFELFRRELKDIEIITYDELALKMQLIYKSMQ